jgi:uncharacterized Zn-finger protein
MDLREAFGRTDARSRRAFSISMNRQSGSLWCGGTTEQHVAPMAEHIVPHFHNDPGVPVIEIGAREFKCVGATPPFDHPHVYLDMGDDAEIICPYCSTLYRHDPSLEPRAARPPACALTAAA